ncbi:TPA: restriction endonuclease, partial [Enterococcus faecium]|nr:restriction endonuclease [Enterococcus faecium]
TFWLLPRVNAAKALEKLLNAHPTFKDYKVVLAAGDGVSLHDGAEAEALDLKENTKSFDKVRNAIEQNDKTITLSVGQLTTGVTIPEWTAVFMLNNIESPSLYFQAAFRSQNPYEYEKDGKLFRKENAYIFDFSPDRTLRLYDEFANNLSSGSSKTSEERKRKIKKLL